MALFEDIQLFFEQGDETSLLDTQGMREGLEVASCVVLLETACIDDVFTKVEEKVILDTLIGNFGLSEERAGDVYELAGFIRLHKAKLGLYLDLLRKHFDQRQRQLLYAAVWKVIASDKVVDERERNIGLRLGGLLELPLDAQIEARQMVMEGQI